MRNSLVLLILAATVALAVPAFADLQNVQVGGSIQIRGNWWLSTGVPKANTDAFVEQRTRLNVKADFTDSVSAFIELDSYDIWGEDFRSNYLTGVDYRAVSTDDVEVYQAYIEANEMWGTGLKARIGRQEIKWGSGWLLSNQAGGPFFTGLSFDAVRLTYGTDQFSVEALWAKLVENSPLQEDGDQDLYGVYASYKGIENVSLDAYWLYVRDAALTMPLFDEDGALVLNRPTVMNTHTVGLRGAGTLGAFDFEAEAAYQWSDLDVPIWALDADRDAIVGIDEHNSNSDAWAANLELGYTFDMNYTPRVFVGGAYFEGSKDGASFNRLFSGWKYTQFYQYGLSDAAYNNLSNFWTARAGVSAMPTESLKLQLSGAYLDLVEDFGGDADLGWEIDLAATYAYTQDLSFEVGYSHFFTGDALKSVFVDEDANVWTKSSDDLDYFYFQTKLSF